MKNTVLSPAVADAFACIGGACPYTCCQEWNISVDKKTQERWKKQPAPTGTIKGRLINATIRKDEDQVMRMRKDHQCILLREDGLCPIVIQFGEECLSKTCHEFPRQIQRYKNRTELSVSISCPIVIDLLKDHGDVTVSVPDELMDEPLAARLELMKIVQYTQASLSENLLVSFYALLTSCEKKEAIAADELNDPGFRSSFRQAIENLALHPADSLVEQNGVFEDLIVNYQEQGMYQAFLAPLSEAAAAFNDRINLQGESGSESADTAIQPFELLFKRCFALEIFSSMAPEEDCDDLLIWYQWLLMEFAAVRHALYLKKRYIKADLVYEDIREALVILSRIMGFCHADIEEYMETAFENVFWDTGYAALLLFSN